MSCRQNLPYISHPRVEMDRSHLTKRILQLTLEIIYLLTGEDYGPIKKSGEPQLPSLRLKDKKILEVTQKIIELLTGEVPIRCQDVSVYFSMEEWEYLEGHRDLYKDVMMEYEPPVTSPVLLSGGPESLICPSSNCMDKDNSFVINYFTAECSPPEEQDPQTSCEEEEHVPYSDISNPTDLSLPNMEKHPSCEKHPLNSVTSTPIYHTPSSSKEEALTAEEHLPSSHISTPVLHTQSPSSPLMEGSLSAEGHLPHSNSSSSADHIQYISIQIMEEQLSSGEVEHLAHISRATRCGQSAPTDVKVDFRSAVEHVPHADMSLLASRIQSSPTREWFLSSEHVPHSDISTPPEQIQYISIKIIEGPLSCEVEHLSPPEVSTLTRPTPTEVKDEPLSDVEQFPSISMVVHHATSTTTDVKEETFSDVEQFPGISMVVHHATSTTTDVKDETFSDVEHFPHISTATHYATSTTTDVKEEVLSTVEHLPHPSISTPPYVKEEPLSCEERPPSRCNMKPPESIRNTSTSKKEDSNSCEKWSPMTTREPSCIKSDQRSSRSSLPTYPPMHTKQRPFLCGKCGRSYSIISNLDMHMKTHSGDKLYKCWECGEAFSEALLLADHHQRHAAEKEHINAMSLRNHAQGEPSSSPRGGKSLPKEQTFICSKCGGSFSSKSDLIVHAKLHTGVKPYCCPECGKGFTSKSTLNTHWKYHKGDEPFSCPECGRTFNRTADLTRHMPVHTRRNRYCCSKCGKYFRRKAALLKHRQIHSNVPSEEESGPTSGKKDSYDMSHETL